MCSCYVRASLRTTTPGILSKQKNSSTKHYSPTVSILAPITSVETELSFGLEDNELVVIIGTRVLLELIMAQGMSPVTRDLIEVRFGAGKSSNF